MDDKERIRRLEDVVSNLLDHLSKNFKDTHSFWVLEARQVLHQAERFQDD